MERLPIFSAEGGGGADCGETGPVGCCAMGGTPGEACCCCATNWELAGASFCCSLEAFGTASCPAGEEPAGCGVPCSSAQAAKAIETFKTTNAAWKGFILALPEALGPIRRFPPWRFHLKSARLLW